MTMSTAVEAGHMSWSEFLGVSVFEPVPDSTTGYTNLTFMLMAASPYHSLSSPDFTMPLLRDHLA